LKIRYLC